MKLSKRLLAMLLTLVLALTLALPAFAEDDPPEEPNPAMPVITVQPVGGSMAIGELITLRVEAYIPNGDEVGYRWYRDMPHTDEHYSAELTIQAGYVGVANYYVEVFNLAQPELKVTSEAARVEVYKVDNRTLRDRLYGVFVNALALSLYSMYGGPLVFIMAPFAMLIYLPVMTIVELFRWIFK